jgi:hypothetical protein
VFCPWLLATGFWQLATGALAIIMNNRSITIGEDKYENEYEMGN